MTSTGVLLELTNSIEILFPIFPIVVQVIFIFCPVVKAPLLGEVNVIVWALTESKNIK